VVLADLVGVVRACLIVGAAFAVVGGAFLFWGTRRRRRSAARLHSAASGSAHSIAAELVDVGRDLGIAASRNPGLFVAAAFVVGLILGRTRR